MTDCVELELPISVAIPTRNRAHLLPQCLASLAAQTLPLEEFEVIVVDDGSTDDTRLVCSGFESALPLRYLRLGHSGIAAAKNAGLFSSRGRIVLFFDDDDVADANLLRSHLQAHHTHADPAIAILGYTTWHPDIETTPFMHYITELGQELFSYPGIAPDSLLDYTYFWGGRTSAKRAFLTEHGAFNQDFTFGYEDIELGYRLSRHGFRVYYTPEAVSYMARGCSLDDMYQRSNRQGRSLWRFHRLHSNSDEVSQYCRIQEHLEGRETPERVSDLRRYVEAVLTELNEEHVVSDSGAALETVAPLVQRILANATAEGVMAAMTEDGFSPAEYFHRKPGGLTHPVASVHQPPVSDTQDGERSASAPVFVIGAPRSGTTILAWGLAQHSRFWTSGESFILFDLFGAGDRLMKVFGDAANRPSDSWIKREAVTAAEFLRSVGSGFDALFASRAGGRRWVDHTPHYALMAPILADMFPTARFVHILRDGKRVVHSMIHFTQTITDANQKEEMGRLDAIPDWASDFPAACTTWIQYVKAAQQFEHRYPQRCITIKNEDLVHDARTTLGRVFEFLEEDSEDAPTAFLQNNRYNSSFQRDVKAPLKPSDLSRPWEEWDMQQSETFNTIAGDLYDRCGFSHGA